MSVIQKLMVSIMMTTPTIVTTEVISWVALCCKVWRCCRCRCYAAEDLAVGASIEELQRQPGQLLVHVSAHVVYGLLRHARHQILLQVAENAS